MNPLRKFFIYFLMFAFLGEIISTPVFAVDAGNNSCAALDAAAAEAATAAAVSKKAAEEAEKKAQEANKEAKKAELKAQQMKMGALPVFVTS